MYTMLGSNTKICAECCGGCNWSRLTKAFVAVCIVVTWPIAVPVYGAVWLLSVVAASDAINKFTDNYWFVISLRFLNDKALAMPGPTRPLSLHADMPAVQHVDAETGTDQINPFSNGGVSPDSVLPAPIDPWESPHFSTWDNPTIDDYVTSTLENARRLGECFDARDMCTRTSRYDYTFELLHACHPGKSIADTLIIGCISVRREMEFNIWRYYTRPIYEDGYGWMTNPILAMGREGQIALLNYLHRYYPDSADGCLQKLIEHAKAENKFPENYRDIVKAKTKFLENYRDIVKATPKERINHLFDGNGRPTDKCMNFPPPFVAEVWKARQQDMGQLFLSMNMNIDSDILRTLHVLHGFPITEVVDALQTLSDEDLARLLFVNSDGCGHLWAVHIFMRMDLARVKKIFLQCDFRRETIFMFVDTMRRKNPQRYAEIFSLVPDKDPPIGNLLYVHILNMPVDAAVAFLAQNDDILHEMVDLIPCFVRAFPTEQICRICWEILSNAKLSSCKYVNGHNTFRECIAQAGFVFGKHIFQVLVERADISDAGVAEFIVANKDCQEPADFVFVNDILCSFPKERAANIRKRVASSNQ